MSRSPDRPIRLAAVFVALVPIGVAAQATLRREIVGHFARPDIVESSGIVASRKQPGAYWTMNDSGGKPEVYAFDLSGRDLGAWMVPGATANDWESLGLGPCAPGSNSDCLYAGDTGDNSEVRRSGRFCLSRPDLRQSLHLSCEQGDWRAQSGAGADDMRSRAAE